MVHIILNNYDVVYKSRRTKALFCTVYVADSDNNRIQKFDSDGKFITKWGPEVAGAGDEQFSPMYIAVDSSGNVYISDDANRIWKLDSNGTFITKWGSNGY